MKSLTTPLCSFLLSLVVFMSSCREPKDLEFREFKNLSVDKIGFSSTNLKVELVYYNPNNFGLELNRADLDIYLDGNYLGHTSQDFQVAIPKRDLFTVPLIVELDMKNLLKNGLNSLFKKEVSIRILGKVKVGKAGVLKSFPVDYTTEQNIDLF